MRLSADIRIQLAYFYVTAAYYASFCRLDGMRCVWILELAALAIAQEQCDMGVGVTTFAVGYWHMTQATHWAYKIAWCACQGAMMGILVSGERGGGARGGGARGGGDDTAAYVARCVLNVTSHIALMRGCGGPTIWPDFRPIR